MHLTPEDSSVELWSVFPQPTNLRFNGATEVSRELLGTATFREEEGPLEVIDDLGERARSKQLLSISNTSAEHLQGAETPLSLDCLVEEVLRPVGLDFLDDRKGEIPAQNVNVPPTFSVFIIHVSRSRPGRIITDATKRSIAN